MKNKQFLPADYLELSIETYINGLIEKTNYVSGIILFLFISVIIWLSFGKINVVINGEGKIRNISKLYEINSPVSGKISKILVGDNCNVKKNQPIVLIEISALRDSKYMELYLNEIMAVLNNFKSLINLRRNMNSNCSRIPVKNTLPFNDQAQFKIQRVNSEFDYRTCSKMNRKTMPWQFYKENENIDPVESCNYLSDYLLIQFQNNIDSYNTLYQKLNNYDETANTEARYHSVKSPVEGKIENISHLKTGSDVVVGNRIAAILHDVNFAAEINISSKNIKKIYIGHEVWINISEFQYNKSESINGRIISISDDTARIGGQSYYKVRCELDKSVLTGQFDNELLSGREISINARLFIGRIKLFNYLINNLLNDKILN